MVSESNLFETPLNDKPVPSVLLQCTAWIRQAMAKDSAQTTQTVVLELRKQDEGLRTSAVNRCKRRASQHSHICLTTSVTYGLSVRSMLTVLSMLATRKLRVATSVTDDQYGAEWSCGMYFPVLNK